VNQAKQGDPESQRLLGVMHYHGSEKTAPDYKEAAKWLLKSVILLNIPCFFRFELLLHHVQV